MQPLQALANGASGARTLSRRAEECLYRLLVDAESASRIQALEIICHAYTLQSLSTTVARGELESARQVFAILIEGIWFAQDSPLEEGGFEPSVPLVAKPVVS
jgi:hypothetical protein